MKGVELEYSKSGCCCNISIALIDRAYQCYFPRYAPTMLAQASTKSCSDLVKVPSK